MLTVTQQFSDVPRVTQHNGMHVGNPSPTPCYLPDLCYLLPLACRLPHINIYLIPKRWYMLPEWSIWPLVHSSIETSKNIVRNPNTHSLLSGWLNYTLSIISSETRTYCMSTCNNTEASEELIALIKAWLYAGLHFHM